MAAFLHPEEKENAAFVSTRKQRKRSVISCILGGIYAYAPAVFEHLKHYTSMVGVCQGKTGKKKKFLLRRDREGWN